jgi:hypothetical protein
LLIGTFPKNLPTTKAQEVPVMWSLPLHPLHPNK